MMRFFCVLASLLILYFEPLVFSGESFLELNGAYYYPTDKRFREVYSNAGAIWGVEFNTQAWKKLFVWGEVNYFSEEGKTDLDVQNVVNGQTSCDLSKIKRDHTHIKIVPLSLGLKYFLGHSPFRFYLGAGASAFYLNTEAHSKHLVRKRTQWNMGGVFKSGFLFNLPRSFLIDIFADYYLMQTHLHRSKDKKVIVGEADLSGFAFGGGVGYAF
jgi:outer membrane protein W